MDIQHIVEQPTTYQLVIKDKRTNKIFLELDQQKARIRFVSYCNLIKQHNEKAKDYWCALNVYKQTSNGLLYKTDSITAETLNTFKNDTILVY